MRKVENESNNFSYFIKGKYVIEFSPNSRGFSGRPDQFLSIRWMHFENTSWNSRGCVKRAVGKSGEVSSIYPSIVLYRPTWMAKVQRKYPALQLDKRSEILEVKASQSLLSVVFASWILVSLTSGLISGINCRTTRSSDGASRSGPLLQRNNFRYLSRPKCRSGIWSTVDAQNFDVLMWTDLKCNSANKNNYGKNWLNLLVVNFFAWKLHFIL